MALKLGRLGKALSYLLDTDYDTKSKVISLIRPTAGHWPRLKYEVVLAVQNRRFFGRKIFIFI